MFRCDSGLRPIVEEALQRCGENLSADEYRACLQNGAGSNLEDLDDVREGGGSSGLGSNKGVKVPEPDGPPSTTADANQGDFESAAATFEMEADNIIAAGEQCRQTLDDTERCCAQPEKCIGEALGDSKGEVGSAAYKAFQIIGGFAGQFPASSIGAVCGRMKTVAVGFAAINSALSLKCSQKVRQCKSTCGSVAARARQQHEAYKSLPLKARQLYGGELLSKQTQLSQLAQAKDQCSRYDNAAVEKAFQAVSSAYASKMADMCKSQASTMPDPSQIARNQFDVDCSSPANAANPICQNQCARQGWENDPVCRAAAGLPPLGNNPGGLNAPQPAPNMPALADSTGLDEFEDRQNFEGAMAPAGQNKVNGGGTGGSGGLSMGGGGDFGGGGAGGGQGGDGGQGGYNTNVLAGNVRTGGGFSVPVMRGSAGGGYRGGAYNGARAPASTGKPFNPKDFLPGGRLDPKRKVAGLASAIPDIGAIHGDIFKNISVRFYEVCLRDGLYDCATLRKRGRPGN